MTMRESAMQLGRATARAIREMIRAISMPGIFYLSKIEVKIFKSHT